jgi:hypothetical protein
MKKAIILLFALFTTQINLKAQASGIVLSNKSGWHKIGDVSASFKLENESIMVMGADKFKAIKLKVTDAPINIESMDIYYENGEVETSPIKDALKAGDETRTIHLKMEMPIKKVVFVYKTLPNSNKEKAKVELYGYK